MITLTKDQKDGLQKTANFCMQNGYSSTMFARAVNTKAQILGFEIESEDDFYNMIHGNQPMKDILIQLGYIVSKYGFWIGFASCPDNVIYTHQSESTWQ